MKDFILSLILLTPYLIYYLIIKIAVAKQIKENKKRQKELDQYFKKWDLMGKGNRIGKVKFYTNRLYVNKENIYLKATNNSHPHNFFWKNIYPFLR